MLLDCNTLKQNLGLSRCNRFPAQPRTMITTGPDFKLTPVQLATEASAKAALQAAILAGYANRIYLWPFFVGFENISEEAVFEDNPLAYMHVRDGNYRFRFLIKESLCLHRAMYTHRATNGRAFIYDSENQLIGTRDAEDNFYGFTIQTLTTEKLQISDGTVTSKSPIVLALANNLELDLAGGIIQAPFINTLERLADVKLTIVGAPSATTIKVRVVVECDDTPVNGLIDDDFLLRTDAGVIQNITGVTEVDGEYTLTGTGLVSGTLTLVAPDVLSVTAYEAQKPATVTIA
jgi:hypothetical protein